MIVQVHVLALRDLEASELERSALTARQTLTPDLEEIDVRRIDK